MPTPMEILLSQQRGPDTARAMSNGLRRNKDLGTLAMLSGDPGMGRVGAGMADDAGSQLKLRMAQKDKADQREMTQGYYDQMSSQNALANTMSGRKQDETERHNLKMEEAAMMRATKSAMKTPSVAAQKRTGEVIESYEGLTKLLKRYKEDYANNTWLPFEGKLSNTIGKFTGTEAQKDQARWWADYDLMYTLGRRNKLFGSALTEPEIEAWEGANISPNSPPDVIERGLKTLMEIATRKLKQQYASDASIYDPDWVGSSYAQYTGGGPSGDEPPSGGPPGPPDGNQRVKW